jgi:hypothetical protein
VTPDQFTLAMQIEIVQREIRMRQQTYPHLISTKKMSAHTAATQLAGMRAVLKTLESLRAERRGAA